MKIRTFDLLNSKGEAYTLTTTNKYQGFMMTVDGLGFNSSREYQRIGEIYEPLTDYINQGEIEGAIRFNEKYAYQAFSRFALFCQDKNLTLYYRTPSGLFKRDGAVTKIEKSEGSDSLVTKITFTATTPWYRDIEASANNHQLSIDIDTEIESPCVLMFKARYGISELTWNHYVGSDLVMQGGLTGLSVAANDVIVIRTDTNPYRIYNKTQNTNLYSKSDFATGRFPLLRKGTNLFTFSTVPIGTPGEPYGYISIEGKLYYETI